MAGGGAAESPVQAARREAAEEAGLDGDIEFVLVPETGPASLAGTPHRQ
ncbi:NUDIX domain-containing protein [Streptomyces hainanensis]